MADKPVAAGKSSFDLIDSEKAFAIMEIRPDSHFLDLACGIGRYSIAVAERMGKGGMVYAVDLWREGIAALDREIESRGIKNIRTMVADIRSRLPLAADSIDACLLATILHDLSKDDRKTVLQESSRLLQHGGLLHVIEFKKIDDGPGPPLRIRLAEEEIEELVAPLGFIKESGSEVGQFNYLARYRKAAD